MSFKKYLSSRFQALSGNGAVWLVLQQCLMRALVGIKFLLIARLLGPEAVGIIGVGLLVLAIAEAVSDTGVGQAIVQKARPSDIELGAAWSLLILRGCAIGLVMMALAPFLASQFHVAGAMHMLLATAAVPVIRGFASPCVWVWLRDRRFSRIAITESSIAAFDFALALAGVFLGMGVYAVVGAMILSELCRSVTLFILSAPTWRPNFRLRAIKHYTTYSRWIWADSLANNLLLNQFDRIVVGKWFGPESLGVYQMTSKLSQMIMFDLLYAYSQYLFPTFSSQFRKAQADAYHAFKQYLFVIGIGTVVVFICAQVCAGVAIRVLLGPSWEGVTQLLRIALAATAFRALGTVLTAYLRATNRPGIVTQGLMAQGCVLLVAIPLGGYYWQLNGVVAALVPGAFVSMVWMLFGCFRRCNIVVESAYEPRHGSEVVSDAREN
ncbi:polysaccharide biosynthesis protein [Caballeronia arvi]|uniref:Polysaccharide biosynthesis protein n=1 Tax=Caballeronia arvi TaxID=1777135 RepID=A0A158KZ44_9BURK|nr:oligosaccharide flippase family protein [Caballeronia arvi]SAL86426.1 polysaccharide biosynthesis protein [Caballeronia arvi]